MECSPESLLPPLRDSIYSLFSGSYPIFTTSCTISTGYRLPTCQAKTYTTSASEQRLCLTTGPSCCSRMSEIETGHSKARILSIISAVTIVSPVLFTDRSESVVVDENNLDRDSRFARWPYFGMDDLWAEFLSDEILETLVWHVGELNGLRLMWIWRMGY